jgi:hypothetical protein
MTSALLMASVMGTLTRDLGLVASPYSDFLFDDMPLGPRPPREYPNYFQKKTVTPAPKPPPGYWSKEARLQRELDAQKDSETPEPSL